MTFRIRPFPIALVIAAGALALTACGGGVGDDDDSDPPDTSIGNTVAVTAGGRIISFDRTAPATLLSDRALSGLNAGEQIVGIDVRPADGRLYALTNQARLYTVEAATGVATPKSTLAASAGDDNPFSALAGTAFGVDFNPVVDRLRVVGNTGQNLRINVDTGAVITDGNSNGAAASITGSAYTNSFAGTTTTQLYALDAVAGMLYLQSPPNDGTLAAPLSLGVIATAQNGFDIDPVSNIGYAALAVAGSTRLYTVSLGGGTATAVGTIGNNDSLVALALVPTRSAPTAIVLTSASQLASFDPASPNTLGAPVTIAGLGAGESVFGIDFRPANRSLYALTNLGRVLIVDPQTGASALASTLFADPADATAPYAGLTSGTYSVDFNPAADRLRVVTASGANLRINVDTGATTTDAMINRAIGATVTGAAYTNSFAGATTTRLYDVDATLDVLAEQVPPNNGTLVDIGPLGLNVLGPAPIDIAGGDNGLVLGAFRTLAFGPSSLYTVTLSTGAATLYRNSSGNAALSLIGGAGGPEVLDIAIRY